MGGGHLAKLKCAIAISCCCCCVTSVVSDSVRPHRQQPSRLPRPWDSPDKSTGVGCHFLLQCMKVKSESEATQCPTLSDPMDCSLPGSSVHGILQARVLEWGAIAFSGGTPRGGGILARGAFYIWAVLQHITRKFSGSFSPSFLKIAGLIHVLGHEWEYNRRWGS